VAELGVIRVLVGVALDGEAYDASRGSRSSTSAVGKATASQLS
jgi:hypothetical protein